MNGNANCPMLVIAGNVTKDAFLRADCLSSTSPDKISLRSASGQTCSIPLSSRPHDRAKLTAAQPILKLINTQIVDHVRAGGAAQVACTVAEIHNGTPVKVLLVNECDESPELVSMCTEKDIDQVSLGCIRTPVNIIAGNGLSNRLVIKERIRGRRKRQPKKQSLNDINNAVKHADAVAVVSPKDGRLASTVLSSSNGARKYFQPAESLPQNSTLRLAAQANHIVCNLAEAKSLAASANIPVRNLSEQAPEAMHLAACLARQLRRKNLAGKISMVISMGRKGAIAADWRKGDRVYSLAFNPFNDSAVVPTLPGTGDLLLGAMIFFNCIWASLGFLKDPVMASTYRAMQFVCDKLGLARNSYAIDTALI